MIFEAYHSFNEEEFQTFSDRNFSFMPHIHRAFEFYLQTDGISEVVIDKRTYILHAGEAVLIFPFQCHSYRAIENSADSICIFSPGLVPDFYKNGKLLPADHRFSFDRLPGSIDNWYLCRAMAYEICGQFERGRTYTENKNSFSQDKVIAILLYANENFRQKCGRDFSGNVHKKGGFADERKTLQSTY